MKTSYTHCPKDTIDLLDIKLIKNAAEFIREVVSDYKLNVSGSK